MIRLTLCQNSSQPRKTTSRKNTSSLLFKDATLGGKHPLKSLTRPIVLIRSIISTTQSTPYSEKTAHDPCLPCRAKVPAATGVEMSKRSKLHIWQRPVQAVQLRSQLRCQLRRFLASFGCFGSRVGIVLRMFAEIVRAMAASWPGEAVKRVSYFEVYNGIYIYIGCYRIF